MSVSDAREMAFRLLAMPDYRCDRAVNGVAPAGLTPLTTELFSNFELIERTSKDHILLIDSSRIESADDPGLVQIGYCKEILGVTDAEVNSYDVLIRPPDETITVRPDKQIRDAIGEEPSNEYASSHKYTSVYHFLLVDGKEHVRGFDLLVPPLQRSSRS